jgi:hypothetical protein
MRLKGILAAVIAVAFTSTAATASTVYKATTAYKDSYGIYGDGHSLTLNGDKYSFGADGRFVDDGATATLTGNVFNSSGGGYYVDLSFNLIPPGTVPAPSPKKELKSSAYSENGGPVDVSTWSFWSLIEGGVSTLTGTNLNAGLNYDVISKPINGPYYFQSGFGANGKNVGDGLSGWLYLQGTTTAAMNTNTCGAQAGQTCDFNIDLSTVPLPASAVLLIGGLAGLGTLRRRRKPA